MCLAPSAPPPPPAPAPLPPPPEPPAPPPSTVSSKVGTIQTAAKGRRSAMGASALKAPTPLPTITGTATGLNVPGSTEK